jgi:short-subunit dehydrogenase
MLYSIVGALILYALIAYIRRKYAKPNYNGKYVWITGASSGIGEYLAYEFNRLGAYVILSARNMQELERVKKSCPFPEKVQLVRLDMTDFPEVEKVTKEILRQLESSNSRLDVLVENAGVSMRCEFLHYAFENHRALFEVNVHGPYRHMQLVAPHMVNNRSGQIVGITSQAGKLATAYRTSYAGSKHAFIGILDSLRTELHPFNVQVCNVMPGYIRTNLSKNALAGGAGEKFGKTDTNIETGMDPERFAREAVGAIYNKENEVSIADKWFPVAGIIIRNLCPDLYCRFMLFNAKNQSKAVADAKAE